MTKATIDVERLVEGIHKYIGEVVRPLVERLAALEKKQLNTLADSYKGAHLPGVYKRGDLVTSRGNLWIAVEDATGTPGGSPSWRLIVKAGRDGKDAVA